MSVDGRLLAIYFIYILHSDLQCAILKSSKNHSKRMFYGDFEKN